MLRIPGAFLRAYSEDKWRNCYNSRRLQKTKYTIRGEDTGTEADEQFMARTTNKMYVVPSSVSG